MNTDLTPRVFLVWDCVLDLRPDEAPGQLQGYAVVPLEKYRVLLGQADQETQ